MFGKVKNSRFAEKGTNHNVPQRDKLYCAATERPSPHSRAFCGHGSFRFLIRTGFAFVASVQDAPSLRRGQGSFLFTILEAFLTQSAFGGSCFASTIFSARFG